MSVYGLILGICLLIGTNYFTSHNTIIPKSRQTFFIIATLFFSILGARLYHVIDQWTYYSQHLILIPQTWNGGLALYGGLIAGFLFAFFYSKIYQIKFIALSDLITPIIPLCQSIGRFGNFFNQENPTWWLESLLCFFLYLYLKIYPKNPTAKYLIGYGLIRFFVEFFRTDTWTISSIKIAHLISLFFIFLGLSLTIHGSRSQITSPNSKQHSLDS